MLPLSYPPAMPAEHPARRLQLLDSEADRLRDERSELPERSSLQADLDEDRVVVSSRAEAVLRLEILRRDERTIEAKVADIAARAKGFEDSLYSGRVTAPKELAVLQAELASCKAKQGEVEESELELMERGERLEGEITAMDARRGELERSADSLRAEIAAQEQRIDGELARLEEARKSATPAVAESLLAAYEKLRGQARLGGVVTSHLDENACGTCRMVLPIMEVSRIKAEDPGAYVPCPACQRLILI